jgi:hypothetical protein
MARHDKALSSCPAYPSPKNTEDIRDERIPLGDKTLVDQRPE